VKPYGVTTSSSPDPSQSLRYSERSEGPKPRAKELHPEARLAPTRARREIPRAARWTTRALCRRAISRSVTNHAGGVLGSRDREEQGYCPCREEPGDHPHLSAGEAGQPAKTNVRRIAGKDWNSIAPQGFKYWERVAEVVNYVRADAEDAAFLMSLLKPLGIEQGKPFQPDARLKKILTDAAEVARAMNQAISMAPRFKDGVYYPGTHWVFHGR
jgi:hypothetical protein